jgi:hypothetical protein
MSMVVDFLGSKGLRWRFDRGSKARKNADSKPYLYYFLQGLGSKPHFFFVAIVDGTALLVAAEGFEAAAVDGRVFGGRAWSGSVDSRRQWIRTGGLLVDDAGGFEGPQAKLAPAGDVHGFAEVVLVAGGGLALIDEGSEEVEEALAGLAGEQDGFGQEAVGGVVARGDVFAADGFWVGGFLGVGLLGGQLLFVEFHAWTLWGMVLGLAWYLVSFIEQD